MPLSMKMPMTKASKPKFNLAQTLEKLAGSSKMSPKQDDAFDSKHGVKENSPLDKKLDKKLEGK